MNFKKILFTLLLLLMMIAVVGCSNDTATEPTEEPNEVPQQEQEQPPTIVVPQLYEERADAATMVLISAPTLQPVDHAGRWNPQLGKESCLACHQDSEATGAREITIEHYNDEDRSKGIFGARNQCITCHGLDSGDTKSAFNRD